MWNDEFDFYDWDYEPPDPPDYDDYDDYDNYEPDNFLDDELNYEPDNYLFDDGIDYTEAGIKSSSSVVAPAKMPRENKRRAMGNASNNDNEKGSKSQRASKTVPPSKKKKLANEQLKRTAKFVAPTKHNPKKTQLPNRDHQKNQPFPKHRKHPKRDLNGAIRKFSASKVKIPKESTKWARKMADTHIEYVRKFCQDKSKGIFNHFEFTGSFYEHLKTEDANELDILVALDTKKNADLEVEEVEGVHGYALIKVTKKSSKYWRFVDDKGYVRPQKVRSWFFGLVQQAVNEYKKKKSEKDPQLKPSDNGPATKLLIDDKEAKKKLEVDLVPAFLFKPKKDSSLSVPAEGRHYVAKQLPEAMIKENMKCTREMLWRQSFSLQEKRTMENLDKDDSGCRREVVKVLKTIVKNDPTLAKLSSYHIKTAFLHYDFDEGQENLEWSGKSMGDRLKGLMEYLMLRIKEKNLSHFFIDELNLLKELTEQSASSLENIEGRLNKLINSESELRRVLAVQPEELNAEAKGKMEAKKKVKKPKRQSPPKPKAVKTAGRSAKSKTKSSFLKSSAKSKTKGKLLTVSEADIRKLLSFFPHLRSLSPDV